MQALDNERVGYLVDVAGALALDFPADVADSGFVSRAGLWVAPSYRPRDGTVEVLALTRWVLDRRSGEDLHQFDFGARSIVNIGAIRRDRWSSSSTRATSYPAASRRPTAWRPTWSTGWERAPRSRSPSGGTTSRRTGPTRASSRGSH